MRVIVSRSGGITGMSVTWQVQVEDQSDAEDWLVLVRALPWAEVRRVAPQPDRFVYRIRCAPNEAILGEQQLHGPWRELVDRVRTADAGGQAPAQAPK